MQQEKKDRIRQERFINIRKLAALDLVFHGSRFILIEFAGAVIIGFGLGIFILLAYFRNSGHPILAILVGLVIILIGLNYVPLLLYAISITRHRSAQQEVAFELEHKEVYAPRYGFQSFLLVLPLVIPLLAIFQEMQKHSHED